MYLDTGLTGPILKIISDLDGSFLNSKINDKIRSKDFTFYTFLVN